MCCDHSDHQHDVLYELDGRIDYHHHFTIDDYHHQSIPKSFEKGLSGRKKFNCQAQFLCTRKINRYDHRPTFQSRAEGIRKI